MIHALIHVLFLSMTPTSASAKVYQVKNGDPNVQDYKYTNTALQYN